ncbi:MAG: hypothetical protein ABI673_08365 [Novosphingobium sp.]
MNLPAMAGPPAVHELRQLPAREQAAMAAPPYDRWLSPDGEVAIEFYRQGADYLLRFPDRADFAIGAALTCTPAPDVPQALITALFNNQIIPMIESRGGALVLHASAIAVDGHALGFLGQSGRGKSTLAASFARAGMPFLTDDGLVLERHADGYVAKPSLPYIRLWPDSESAVLDISASDDAELKSHVSSSPGVPFQHEAIPLRALYLLRDDGADTVRIDRLPPSAALAAFLQHAFVLDVEDRARVRAHFDQMAGLAEAAACFTLDYPRRYDDLPAVRQAILSHAKTGVCPL